MTAMKPNAPACKFEHAGAAQDDVIECGGGSPWMRTGTYLQHLKAMSMPEVFASRRNDQAAKDMDQR